MAVGGAQGEGEAPEIPGDGDLPYVVQILAGEEGRLEIAGGAGGQVMPRQLSQLEQIPIPDVPADRQQPIIELAGKLMTEERREERRRLFAKLDRQVADLFGITDEEYAYVKTMRKDKNDYL